VAITDWLPRPDGPGYVHHECRDCGRNLAATDGTCPACGGERAEYVLE